MSELGFSIPNGYGWQYHLILWIQTFMNPVLSKIAYGITLFGVEGFYVLALPILFWSINKRVGLRITYVFLASMYINAWLKDFLQIARPIGMPGVRSIYTSTGTGYGLPSGHAQGPMTFWLLLHKWLRKKWMLSLALLFIFVVGVSRIYLGLHWVTDVIVGWGLGLIFALLGWPFGKWWTYRRYEFGIRMFCAIGLPVALMLVHRGTMSAQYAALMMGIGVGALLEDKWLKLDIDPAKWKRICTAVIGIAGMIAVQYLIKWPSDVTPLLVVRDVLIGLWGTLGAPYVFSLCGLYCRGEANQA